MKYINLLTDLEEKLFIKQLPTDTPGVTFGINSDEDRVWDAIVVYEDIDLPYQLKCKTNGFIFYSGEPPMVKVYSSEFLKQFDRIVSAHTRIKHTGNILYQQSLPWYFGFDYRSKKIHYSLEELKQLPIPQKSKKISFITSSREFLPGHARRMAFCEELQKQFGDGIDFYGKGIQPLGDKADGILPYCFSICIENSSINNYWTEKIADAFLGYTVPLYYGCKNISDYFAPESYIPLDIRKQKEAFLLIEHLITNADSIYQSKLSAIVEARKSLFDSYNIFNAVADLAKQEFGTLNNQKIIEKELIPSTSFHDTYIDNKRLRIQRFFAKRIDEIL